MRTSDANEFYLILSISRLKIALSLSVVSRAIRVVEISPLPGAPPIALGILNLGGIVIPILNFRKRFGLKNKSISASDKLVIVNTPNLQFGFIVDEIIGLKPLSEKNIKESENIIPGIDRILDGVAVLENELILIHDVEKFLSLHEENQIKKAIQKK